MKKALSLILAALMLLAVLAPAMAEDKVTLKIYAQYADDDTKVPYDYAVEKLKEAYPNVELELIIQAQDDGATLLTLAANHNLPDIFQTGAGIMPTLRASNQMMVLNDVAVPAESAGNSDMNYFIGREGVTHTPLRPAGIGEFDGVKLNVVSDGEFIALGKPIRVQSVEGNRIVVREIRN